MVKRYYEVSNRADNMFSDNLNKLKNPYKLFFKKCILEQYTGEVVFDNIKFTYIEYLRQFVYCCDEMWIDIEGKNIDPREIFLKFINENLIISVDNIL